MSERCERTRKRRSEWPSISISVCPIEGALSLLADDMPSLFFFYIGVDAHDPSKQMSSIRQMAQVLLRHQNDPKVEPEKRQDADMETKLDALSKEINVLKDLVISVTAGKTSYYCQSPGKWKKQACRLFLKNQGDSSELVPLKWGCLRKDGVCWRQKSVGSEEWCKVRVAGKKVPCEPIKFGEDWTAKYIRESECDRPDLQCPDN